MKRDSFIIYRSFYEPVKELTKEDKGVLFDAIRNYALDKVDPIELSPMLKMAFSFISDTIDRDSEKYQNIVERNRANIGKRWNKKDTKNTTGKTGTIRYSDNGNDTDNVNETKKGKTKVFTPPTLEEFQEYFTENGYSQETAKRAFQGYEVANWVDSAGKQIQSWKQKCFHVWFKPENSNVSKTLNTQLEPKEKTFKAI